MPTFTPNLNLSKPDLDSTDWLDVNDNYDILDAAITALLAAVALKAALDSPTFTGTPSVPTAAIDTNTTQAASTGFVLGQASASGDGTPAMDGTAARGTSTHFARADHVHPTDTSLAPLASPALTGTPTAPTASPGNNSTRISTTAYVDAAIAALINGSPGALDTLKELADALGDDASFATTITNLLALKAALASPTFTGIPSVPTATVDTNTTQAASTAFVLGQASASGDGTPAMDGTAARGTSTHFARADHVHPTDTSRAASSHIHAESDITNLVTDLAAKAPLASPALSGSPTAPTQSVDDNTTKIATTAYVTGQLSASGDGTPAMDGTAARGTSVHAARADHVHPTDTNRAASTHTHAESDITGLVSDLAGKAPLASPALTGTPTAPTQSVDDNSTKIATTAYVTGQLSASGDGTPAMDGTAARGTSAHAARADHVHPTDTSRAPLASPALTGSPTAPTQSANDNSTKIATTAYVDGKSRTAAITLSIDGAGAPPVTGVKAERSIPVACTVTGWVLTGDQSGSAVIDVLRSTYANYPTTASIAGTDKPTLSSARKNENLGPLSNWGSTALAAGDVLQFNLSSVTTCTQLNLTLNVTIP